MNRAKDCFRVLQRTVSEHGDRLPSLRSRPSLVVNHAYLPRVKVVTSRRRQHGVKGANTSTVIVVTRDPHPPAFDVTTRTRREVTILYWHDSRFAKLVVIVCLIRTHVYEEEEQQQSARLDTCFSPNLKRRGKGPTPAGQALVKSW